MRRCSIWFDYGIELGIAFQMIDDALDYVGTEHEFGKPVGHDLAEGKITLPLIHVRDNAPPEVSRRLLELAGSTDTDKHQEAKKIVKEHGGVEATYAAAAQRALKCQQALRSLGTDAMATPEADLLMSLPWYVLHRRH